jgi:hypothetical protein
VRWVWSRLLVNDALEPQAEPGRAVGSVLGVRLARLGTIAPGRADDSESKGWGLAKTAVGQDLRPVLTPQAPPRLHSWCKKCALEATQAWRERNRDELNARRREAYGSSNPHRYPKQRASARTAA